MITGNIPINNRKMNSQINFEQCDTQLSPYKVYWIPDTNITTYWNNKVIYYVEVVLSYSITDRE